MSDVKTLATLDQGIKLAVDKDVHMVYPLTACCGGSATGTEGGVGCRGCYQLIDEWMGDAWIFTEGADNAPEQRRLTAWIEEHGGILRGLAPTLAFTAVLEAL
jgi:hypothetical protein